jgi:hypothetical protein
MQDLGRIVIDINEKGSAKAEGISGVGQMAGAESGAESAAAAGDEIGALASAAGLASTAFTAVAGVFAVMTKVVGEVGKALLALNRFVLEVASDLRDYSPGIQLAEMQNQIAMVNTRFRMGMQYGGAIGAQMLEVGRIERAFVEIRSAFAGMGAIFLRPITKYVADVLENLKEYLPKITEAMAKAAEAVAVMVQLSSYGGTSSVLARMAVGYNYGEQGKELFDFMNPAGGIVATFREMARDLRALNRKTPDPKIDYGAINQPFLADLKLMGMKGF